LLACPSAFLAFYRLVEKNTLSYCRPTGRLDPLPADLAYASLELAALEYRARRGEILLLYEDETVLWRFALPRLGWWRRAQRYRLPTRPLSQSQIRRDESLKRHAWLRYRSWSRITSGVLLNVIGAVQYGTSRVIYKIVPHFDAQAFRQYLHQVMHVFGKTDKEVVMVVDRSGIGFPIVIAKFWWLRNDPAILSAESFSVDTLPGLSLGYRSSCQRHIAVARGT